MLKKFLIMLLLTILFMFGLAQIALAEETESAFMYGIVVDVEADSVVIFTQDGSSITYGYVEEIDSAHRMWGKDIGQLVKYTLSHYGEIDNIEIIKEGFFHQVCVDDIYPTWVAPEITIKNNAYLTDLTGKSLTLASNAIIFEVRSVDGEVNPHLISRSSLLSSGDFTSGTLSLNDSVYLNYAVYDVSSGGAIKALAYTKDNSDVYHYGVVKAYGFKCEDYDLAVTLVGDDRVYALDVSSVLSRSDSFIVYTLSGDRLKILYSFGNDTDLAGYTQMVMGHNEGLITVTNGWEAVDYKTASDKLTFEQLLWKGRKLPANKRQTSIMTDSNTIVYSIDSRSGDYCEGSLADIYRGVHIYVPIVDEDGYADCVLVDEYSRPGNVYGITLDKAYLTLEKNAVEKLNASVWPIDAANKNINWFSSNPDIVMVDTLGNVTALDDGLAVVTATAEDGGKSVTCTIAVGKATEQVYSISLDTTSVSIPLNTTLQLNAIVWPAEALDNIIIWKSSNSDVAVVDDKGNITAVGYGKAVITAAVDKNNRQATCEVFVQHGISGGDDVTTPNISIATNVTGGKITFTPTRPAIGQTVTINVNANEGYRLDKMQIFDKFGNPVDMIKVTDTKYSFVMPNVKVMITPFFVKMDDEQVCYLLFRLNGGTLVPALAETDNRVLVNKGTSCFLPNAVRSGYVFQGWSDGKNFYPAGSYYKVSNDTIFEAFWSLAASSGGSSGGGHSSGKPNTTNDAVLDTNNICDIFADVQNDAWYSQAVAYVYTKGLMNGTEKGFEPNAATTRAMLVTMLYRSENEPVAGNAKFNDVQSGQWFSNAVAWASVNGIVKGYGDGRFAPNEAITREDMLTILYRFAQFKGIDVGTKGNLSIFNDSSEISDWAIEAMQWSVGVNIIEGDNNCLNPTDNATRAEVSMIFMRYLENVVD